MTAARRQRKSRRELIFFLALAAVGLVPVAPDFCRHHRTRRVRPGLGPRHRRVRSRGLFHRCRTQARQFRLRVSFAGVVWRFRNEGNRAAFIANPDVYMPRFGGYDPVAVARGASAPGHAELWAIAGDRLYLFYSAEARDAFAGDPGSAIGAAERVWPAVLRKLSP